MCTSPSYKTRATKSIRISTHISTPKFDLMPKSKSNRSTTINITFMKRYTLSEYVYYHHGRSIRAIREPNFNYILRPRQTPHSARFANATTMSAAAAKSCTSHIWATPCSANKFTCGIIKASVFPCFFTGTIVVLTRLQSHSTHANRVREAERHLGVRNCSTAARDT